MIRDVNGDDAIGIHVPFIEREGLASQQMHRNGVAAECVQRQQVETLRPLPFEGKPGVAQDDFYTARAVGQILEPRSGKAADFRVNFVDAQGISGSTVSRARAGAEPDQTDAPGTWRERAYGQAQAA